MDTILRTLGKLAVQTNTHGLVNYPLNEKNRDTLCTTLIDFNLKINAVWIVSRPIKGYSKQNTFDHWCVKIQAHPILLTMGFVECNKKGAFRMDQTMTSDKNLKDFLYFSINSKPRKLDIISCVTPTLINSNNHMDLYSVHTLKKYVNEKINIKKRVCDIADWIEMWSTDMYYNAISSNCQHFAVDLFAFLTSKQYPNQVSLAVDLMDDGCDKRKYKPKIVQNGYPMNDIDNDEKLDDEIPETEMPQNVLINDNKNQMYLKECD
eukprot:555597_1